MKYELYSRVELLRDYPEDSLVAGDIATIVDFHPGNGVREDGYSLEVFSATGETLAVIGVSETEIAPLSSKGILHLRLLEPEEV